MSHIKNQKYPFEKQDKNENDNSEDENCDNGSSADGDKFINGDLDTEYDRFYVKVLEPGYEDKVDFHDLNEENRKARYAQINAYLEEELLKEEDEVDSPNTEHEVKNLSSSVALTYTILTAMEQYNDKDIFGGLVSGFNKKEFGFSVADRVDNDELVAYLGQLDESLKKQKLLNQLNSLNKKINQAITQHSNSFVKREEKMRNIIMNTHKHRGR